MTPPDVPADEASCIRADVLAVLDVLFPAWRGYSAPARLNLVNQTAAALAASDAVRLAGAGDVVERLGAGISPGRWESHAGLIRACGDEVCWSIAEMRTPYRHGVGLSRGYHEQEANARLLAAAPGLLTLIATLRADNARLVDENFTLAAGVCINPGQHGLVGDERGNNVCTAYQALQAAEAQHSEALATNARLVAERDAAMTDNFDERQELRAATEAAEIAEHAAKKTALAWHSAFRKLGAAFRVNMLRHVPETSHADIDAAIASLIPTTEGGRDAG